MASEARSVVLVASELGEGLPKCESGSAAPQNTRPMPMPAAKSIANHDVREYSGSASSGPKIVSPFREKARAKPTTTNRATAKM